MGSDDVPMIYCFSTCADSIRTIPVLQHDPGRAEDLDTKGEDHAADDPGKAALVDGESICVVARVNGGAAAEQRVREGRPAVVLQRTKSKRRGGYV